ncbi:glycine zipper 2TM domain-containing protein [Sphingosinicella sp. CPCC 101087]|uniref:glycine zipper 2TM domain-containing protein n=1 Tax=Sphingosinicella sp. CPCC 101087 TaxID=2497754 RepID=UPI00101B9B87|nr:glycine zipper 2TM domain-containing protein [Sphingosinicella sp. CPCC 101087]
MRTPLIAAAALTLVPLAGCATYNDPFGSSDGYYERQYRAGRYDPYPLGRDDYVYRGNDGRYYCRRRDGTVGLVVGAGVGAVLGNLIAPRGSRTLGSILGAAGGAAAGYAIERQDLRCE